MHDSSMGFSVTIYFICGTIAILYLMVRRFVGAFGNAELGGNVGNLFNLYYNALTVLLFAVFHYKALRISFFISNRPVLISKIDHLFKLKMLSL